MFYESIKTLANASEKKRKNLPVKNLGLISNMQFKGKGDYGACTTKPYTEYSLSWFKKQTKFTAEKTIKYLYNGCLLCSINCDIVILGTVSLKG